jgi:hypothetical protein
LPGSFLVARRAFFYEEEDKTSDFSEVLFRFLGNGEIIAGDTYSSTIAGCTIKDTSLPFSVFTET